MRLKTQTHWNSHFANNNSIKLSIINFPLRNWLRPIYTQTLCVRSSQTWQTPRSGDNGATQQSRFRNNVLNFQTSHLSLGSASRVWFISSFNVSFKHHTMCVCCLVWWENRVFQFASFLCPLIVYAVRWCTHIRRGSQVDNNARRRQIHFAINDAKLLYGVDIFGPIVIIIAIYTMTLRGGGAMVPPQYTNAYSPYTDARIYLSGKPLK